MAGPYVYLGAGRCKGQEQSTETMGLTSTLSVHPCASATGFSDASSTKERALKACSPKGSTDAHIRCQLSHLEFSAVHDRCEAHKTIPMLHGQGFTTTRKRGKSISGARSDKAPFVTTEPCLPSPSKSPFLSPHLHQKAHISRRSWRRWGSTPCRRRRRNALDNLSQQSRTIGCGTQEYSAGDASARHTRSADDVANRRRQNLGTRIRQ